MKTQLHTICHPTCKSMISLKCVKMLYRNRKHYQSVPISFLDDFGLGICAKPKRHLLPYSLVWIVVCSHVYICLFLVDTKIETLFESQSRTTVAYAFHLVVLCDSLLLITIPSKH